MQLPGHLFAVFCVTGLLSISLCQDCKLQNGEPGQAGLPGRDGWLGQKGEKGEPGLQVQLSQEALAAFKGDEGEQGPMGDIGIQGYQGLLGPPGPPGPPGPVGTKGGSSGDAGRSKAAFSVLRTNKLVPSYNHPVTFDKAITNVNNYFNLQAGHFTCNVAGVYYFVFHSVSEGNLCLQLMSDSNPPLNLFFCDFNQRRTSQVVSGGAVIKLAQNNKVWIQPFKNPEFGSEEHNKMSTKSEMSTVFSGFLVFATG